MGDGRSGEFRFVKLVVNAMRDAVGKEWFSRWWVVDSSVEWRNQRYFCSSMWRHMEEGRFQEKTG